MDTETETSKDGRGGTWQVIRRWRVLDWVGTLFVLGSALLIHFMPHFHRKVLPGDPDLSYPHKHSQVPTMMLPLYTGLLPIVVMAALQVMRRRGWDDTRTSLLGLGQSITYCFLLTEFLKKLGGRPRPNFFAVCGDDYVTTNKCADVSMLNEEFSSFPSGHSSIAFAGLFYLSLYILGNLRVCEGPERSLKLYAAMLPVLLAGWIASTRIQDYWHNYSDVATGTVMGVFFASAAYFVNYPSVFSVTAGVPLERMTLREHVTREEAGDRLMV